MISEQLQHILDSNPFHAAALVDPASPLDSPFEFVLSGLSNLGLDGINNLSALLTLIDPHGDICEGKGYKQYLDEIMSALKKSSKEHLTFLLPLIKDGGKEILRSVLLLEYSYLPELNKSLVFFTKFDKGTALSDLSGALNSSYKDTLTGLFNLNTAYDHLYRNRDIYYFCLFDLNKFKKINDLYGHTAGDDVLKKISEGLIRLSTGNEMFYRHSGDEFMMFVKKDSKEYVQERVDGILKMMENLRKKEFSYMKEIGSFSAAFGILRLDPWKLGGDFFKKRYVDIVKLADIAMHEAKYRSLPAYFLSEENALKLLKKGNIDELMNLSASRIRR